MRDELKKAATDRGWTEGQELLRRLNRTFTQDAARSRDPALQALCFLISEVAEGVTFPFPMRVQKLRPLWRSNPFLFQAFKLAVAKLLDTLEPPGEIKSPTTLEVAEGVTADVTTPEFLANRYVTPDALADFVVAGISQALKTAAAPERKRFEFEVSRWDSDDDYRMLNAQNDLKIKS